MQYNSKLTSSGFLPALVLALLPGAVAAFTVTITAGSPKEIYLQVGVGSFVGHLNTNGTPQNNTTINSASVSVPAGSVGNGAAQVMTTDSTASASFWDGYSFCNTPAQMYIGGFYRNTASGSGIATVTATVPVSLVDAAGDQIAFSNIAWNSGGNGDSGSEPFAGGTFVKGGVQTVGVVAQNQWAESCWTFRYANTTVPPQGTYSGRVLFTMTAP